MKKTIIGGVVAVAIAAVAAFNVHFNTNAENELSAFSINHVEALASEEGGYNHWSQWLSQGLTKDEREFTRPCPSSSSSGGSGSASYGGGSVSGSGNSSQTNPSNRYEITCPYGSDNCTSIGC